MNKDNFFLGFILSLIAPLIGIVIVWAIRYLPQNISFNEFTYLVSTNPNNITRYVSLGGIAIIPLIAYYNKKKRVRTLYGIFVSIMIYAIIAVGYKFHIFY